MKRGVVFCHLKDLGELGVRDSDFGYHILPNVNNSRKAGVYDTYDNTRLHVVV